MTARSPEAIARAKEYDRVRSKAKRVETKADPERQALALARRREIDRLKYLRRLAAQGKTLRMPKQKVEKPPKAPKPTPIVIAKPRTAPAYHRWSPETEAVNPNKVEITYLPTPPARFHVEAPSDGFASMGIGRYAA